VLPDLGRVDDRYLRRNAWKQLRSPWASCTGYWRYADRCTTCLSCSTTLARPGSGADGDVTAAIVALIAFRTPRKTLAVASGKGVWDAIFILYVIWPVLLLYQVTKQARAYDALRQGIARFSPNEPFIILALSWVFASFLQGIAGFGAPVAVVVPLAYRHRRQTSLRWPWGSPRMQAGRQ
jgi:hypothetical protein